MDRPLDGAPLTLLCVPGTMCTPRIFDGLSTLGLPLTVASWLEWPPPHDMTALGAAVAALADRHAPVVLIGHSTGGVIALSAALRASAGSVAGLVLCDTGANMRGHGDVTTIIEQVRTHWGPDLWEAIVRRSLHNEVSEEAMAELVNYPARITQRAVEEALTSQYDTDLLPELPRLSALPTLVVHGRHDAARTPAHAEQLANGLAAELVVLDCGHTPPLELPEQFSATVRHWLSGLPVRPSCAVKY